jgi:hypothetical protein
MGSQGDDQEREWTAEFYLAKIRASGLRPSRAPHVYLDEEGAVWSVDDPETMTPAERRES